jgi:hypothetical protein
MKKTDRVPCPHCGEEIDPRAKACPHCGSDDMTGWSEDVYLDGIELPGDDDYEEIRRNEFGGGREKPSNRTWIVVTGIIILVVFLLGVLRVLG